MEGLPSFPTVRVGMGTEAGSYPPFPNSMPNPRSPSMRQGSSGRFANSTSWIHEPEVYNPGDDIPDTINTSREQWDPSPGLGRSSLVSDRTPFIPSVRPSSRFPNRDALPSRNPPFQTDSGVPDITHEIYDKTSVASGGYSRVYRALWKMSQGGSANVAVKILRIRGQEIGYGDKTIKRLKREARLWILLNHPNIVPLLGFVSAELGPGLVSPWYSHGDVLQYIRRFPNVPREPLCKDVASGLRYLHERNPPIVHGDLKAANVVVAMDGRAALCDFGLSVILDSGPTGFTSSIIGGTLRFLAPEQLSDDQGSRSPPSDVYAFGCLYAEIMTGDLPFSWYRKAPPIIRAICQGDPPYKVDSIVSNHDLGFLQSCWNPEPTHRPTITKICQALGIEDM
ncbi:hypothetical protein BS47DRAFT_1396928 [Hydnum rufescens UP504]|uniref:Protein kinase domain-containing protein n=1 Tax=Hydnum rufescens UP504 TaxID=1448309 RepID=A0A9P6APB7_9AGAM|nr:hypothetical protein BS47DRAFT_1396928 [Hydnum rufescens UP504]